MYFLFCFKLYSRKFVMNVERLVYKIYKVDINCVDVVFCVCIILLQQKKIVRVNSDWN